MGAEQSKGKSAAYGSIFLQTDKSAYLGGDTVTGTIFLNLLLPFPGNQISLKFRGKEYAAFVETVKKEETMMENGFATTKFVDKHTLHEDKNQIIKMVVPAYSWPVVLPGQYSIPFAFVLPQNLPSSFHQEGHQYVADIAYTLSAVLEPAVKDLADKLKYKQPFVVRQPIKSAMQGVGSEITTNLTACCSGKGKNILKAKFEKTFYAPGEVAQVVMQLDNTQSQLANTAINFSLKQKLCINVKGKEKAENFVKVQRSLPGIPAGGASDSNFISINLPKFQAGEWSQLKTLNIVDHLNGLKDTNDSMNCATRGKFVTSEFFLEVATPMDGCCAPAPVISCPIEIYYPEVTLFKPQVPPGWSPQVVSCVNLSFGGPAVQMNAGGMSVNVNMDPLAMAAGTMMAAGNMAMTGPNMTITTNTQQSGGFQPNGGASNGGFQPNGGASDGGFQPNGGFQANGGASGGFQPNGGQQDGFHINMTTNVQGHHEVNNGGFHAEFKMN